MFFDCTITNVSSLPSHKMWNDYSVPKIWFIKPKNLEPFYLLRHTKLDVYLKKIKTIALALMYFKVCIKMF